MMPLLKRMLQNDLRTTVNIDDALVVKAQELTGIDSRSELLREALTALIQREAARRLARLGRSAPDLQSMPRRREESHDAG